MIMDYLTYKAINTCFASRQPHGPDSSAVKDALLEVDQILNLFKRRYPGYRLDPEIRFRQQLLQLVALFTQRLTRNSTTPPRASLQALRENNQVRARRWIGSADRLPTAGYPVDPYDKELPLSSEALEENRASTLLCLGAPAEDDAYEDELYGTKECVSLLDLLPLFIKISAICCDEFGINPGDNWKRLAREWMLQACLEQYLVFGAAGTDAIDEAFAWGYKEESTKENGEEQENQANSIFYNSDSGAEIRKWQGLKEEMLEELFLAADGTKDLVTGLMELRTTHPIQKADQDALGYLQALSQVIDEPVLVQLEKGQLKGMSKEATNDFMRTCGVETSDLFGEE